MDSRKLTYRPRVHMTKDILFELFNHMSREQVSDFAREKGLPYLLIYNLVYGRVKSLSAKDYRLIFGEEPPRQEPERIDGEYFRGMVRMWLFLNSDATKKDLYKGLFSGKEYSKVDYRIFTGEVQTVRTRLERMMERKFFDQGLSRQEIQTWIKELEESSDEERVPYEKAKPILDHLKEVLGINLKGILNQSISRYESGQLRTISMKRYRRALNLEKRAAKALQSGSTLEKERLREEIGMKREGFTLFSEVEDQLEFLRRHCEKGPKHYLGRSMGDYKKSRLKRIASWRAERIKEDGDRLIKEKPEILVSSLPKFHMRRRISELLLALKAYLIKKMIEDDRGTYERAILTPSWEDIEEYRKGGYIGMDCAGSALGMDRKAFDLMVAVWSDIFRRIAKYDGKWYLPNLYIENLKEKEGFDLVKAKYELLAQGHVSSSRGPRGWQKAHLREEPPASTTVAARDDQEEQTPGYRFMASGSPPCVKTISTELQGFALVL